MAYSAGVARRFITVAETPLFSRQAREVWDDVDREAFIDFIARNPEEGDLIPETGGVRKIRWARPGSGKRGGARVIYFHHNADMPLVALTAFAKNERADLSQQDRNDFRRLTTRLVEAFKRRKP